MSNPLMMAGPQEAGPQELQGEMDGTPETPPAAPTPTSLSAQYAKLQSADATLKVVRKALDGLVELADTVTPEDVVKAAGSIVSHGLDPMAMANLLADMPDNSQALQDWVKQHDMETTQREQQLAAATHAVRHQMGTMALRKVLLTHMASQGGQLAMAPPSDTGGTL